MVVVLAGMHQEFLVAGLGQGGADGRSFDELGPGADDAQDLHGLASCGRWKLAMAWTTLASISSVNSG